MKTFNVEIEGASPSGGDGGRPVDPNRPTTDDNKVKSADIDSTVDLACEMSSEGSPDLKWRKLDGVRILEFTF